MPLHRLAPLLLLTAGCLTGLHAALPSDPDATPAARAVLERLEASRPEHLLYGHHFTELMGFGWRRTKPIDAVRSDVRSLVGDFPALFGYDFNRGPEKLLTPVKDAAARGALITISWHYRNPFTGRGPDDTSVPVMAELLPDGKAHSRFRRDLDDIAVFFRSTVVDRAGQPEPIPIIFRPFHENTGSWFWWGADHCTPETYVAVWRGMVDYLREHHGLHQILYAYSPSDPVKHGEPYALRYPGDAYVDIVGWDQYHRPRESASEFRQHLLANARLVVAFAEEHGKVPAWTEGGPAGGMTTFPALPAWHLECALEPLKTDPVARRLAYWMQWNSRTKQILPRPGEPSAGAFQQFYEDPFTVFLREWTETAKAPPESSTAGTTMKIQ